MAGLLLIFLETASSRNDASLLGFFRVVVVNAAVTVLKLFQHNLTSGIVKCSTARKNFLIRLREYNQANESEPSTVSCPENKRSRPPFVFRPRRDHFQSRRGVKLPNGRQFWVENARKDQCAVRLEPVQDPLRLPDQEVESQIRANYVECPDTAKRQAGQVPTVDTDPFLHPVLKGVGPGHTNGGGVNVEGVDWMVSQLGCCDGKNSGAGADVQHRSRPACRSAGDELLQAKGCRRMLPSAETQARIQHDDSLSSARATTAPARFDEQRAANFQRLEVFFPRISPGLASELSDGDSGGTNIQTAALDLLQTSPQPGA